MYRGAVIQCCQEDRGRGVKHDLFPYGSSLKEGSNSGELVNQPPPALETHLPPSLPLPPLPLSPQLVEYWKPLRNLERAQTIWDYWFAYSEQHCMHGPKCAQRKLGKDCKWGGRQSSVQMISGAVLPIWKVREGKGRERGILSVFRGWMWCE